MNKQALEFQIDQVNENVSDTLRVYGRANYASLQVGDKFDSLFRLVTEENGSRYDKYPVSLTVTGIFEDGVSLSIVDLGIPVTLELSGSGGDMVIDGDVLMTPITS